MATVSKIGGKRKVWNAKSIGKTNNPKTADQLEERGRDIDFWNPGKSRKLKF